jgi:predicted glycoside hydrolase/deacetylase ChbG (UPF0249 family)
MTTLDDLGLGSDVGRVAVVHVDDLGMSHAANEGGFAALVGGPATCGSVMVPCPWFPDAAARARANPDLDLGVHLTLTAEYEHYRWGPVLGAGAVPSLVDEAGYLPRTVEEVVAGSDLDEVERELRAQIDRALGAGIDVTHLDSHMGTMFHTGFFDVYLRLGRDYELPLFVFRNEASTKTAALEADGFPLFDGFCADSLGFEPGEGEAHNLRRLSELGPGLNYLICHAAQGGPELEAITADAHARDFERRFYGGEPGRRALADEGIATLGMRRLRDHLRGS